MPVHDLEAAKNRRKRTSYLKNNVVTLAFLTATGNAGRNALDVVKEHLRRPDSQVRACHSLSCAIS